MFEAEFSFPGWYFTWFLCQILFFYPMQSERVQLLFPTRLLPQKLKGKAVSKSFVSLNFLRFGSWGHKLGIGIVAWCTNASLHTMSPLWLWTIRLLCPWHGIVFHVASNSHASYLISEYFWMSFSYFSPSMSLSWWKKMLFSWQLGRLRVEEKSFKEQMFKTNSSFCKLMACSDSGIRTRINPGTGRNKQKNPNTSESAF